MYYSSTQAQGRYMKRVYDQGTKEDVQYFVGNEVEHTPGYGKKTLFVVGIKNAAEVAIIANFNGCSHVYCGANMSFDVTENSSEQWAPWEAMIFPLLEKKLWVTLDVDISQVEGLLETGFTEHNRFIPMISAKIPYIAQLGYNACLKIDDKGFDATNPGVWVHKLNELTSRTAFTDWSKYTADEIIT